MYSTAPAYSGRYLSANVDFPEPFGPATTWQTGLSNLSKTSFICGYYTITPRFPLIPITNPNRSIPPTCHHMVI